ncbi:MAG: FecCD family ABC transporter permease [Pelagimonas sp.]|uniref:FecCD family ABC transporter permease n=1 Tax=Pelagimonas sp. TaxID=2073170 RepID=UPI003D6C12CC
MRHTQRVTTVLILLLVAVSLGFVWSLAAGAVTIPAQVILNTLFDLDGSQQGFIINRSRLPRSLLAIATGGALALSGTIIQALLRNPLASPKIIGINSGAAFAVLLMSLPGTELGALFGIQLERNWLPLVAATGGLIAAFAVYALAELRSVSPTRLILIGIAVGFTADAGVDFILITADTYDVSAPMVWLTGSLWARGWQHLSDVWLGIGGLALLCLLMSHRLDLIRLGTAQATSLGMNVRAERAVLMALAAMLAALSVSQVGVIGFIGLMSPHIARRLVGAHHRSVLPVAMLTGALLVLIADAAGRAILPPIEVSAGVLTAAIGAPFFIYLLLTTSQETGE